MNNDTSYIYGRNAVLEALKSNSNISKIFISFGAESPQISSIYSLASKKKIACVTFDKRKFAELERKVCESGAKSQGVIALKQIVDTITIAELIHISRAVKNPLIVLLDEITDPHNLGAIARSAECCGASGLILPERNTSPITPVAIKSSAGALEYIPIAYTTNLNNAITQLKDNGYWIVGTSDKSAKPYTEKIYNSPIGLVIGSEGKGIRPSIIKHCDFLVSIDMMGKISSLNASVAAGVIMFEILRQKKEGKDAR